MNLPKTLCIAGLIAFAVLHAKSSPGQTASAASGIPVTIDLPKAGYATVVIEDAKGNRVRNLIAETYLPAGRSVLSWDGYDEGRYSDGEDDVYTHDLVRKRVALGTYRVRGLVHDPLNLTYEFSINSPGTPPWQTKDGSGAWLADHTPPADILALPPGNPAPNKKGDTRFLVCSSSGEAGDEFVWLNENGRRLYGTNQGFWGATHLARDPGPKADPNVLAYTFMSGERDPDNDNIEMRAIGRDGQFTSVALLKFPLEWKKTGELPQFKSTPEEYGSDGLAVYNGLAVFTITRQGRVVFADTRTRKILGEDKAASPRGLAFDTAGHLFMVSGNQVLRYDSPDLAGARLGAAKPVVADHLEAPVRISLDDAGNLYVSDWGKSHQIKVFAPDGRFLRAIGRPGGPQMGLYDDQRMSFPSGATVDSAGRVWVAEADNAPRRLSVWDAKTGAFVRAIYGSAQYGGGGKLDPADPTRVFMDECWGRYGVEWTLDWKAGTGRPYAIYWRGDDPNNEATQNPVPETIFRKNGFRFLTNAYNDTLRYNPDRGVDLWRLGKDEIARPVMLVGNAADLVNTTWGIPLRNRDAITAKWKDLDPATVLYLWTDNNGDGIAQPDEVTFRQVYGVDGKPLKDAGLGPLVLPDLSIVMAWGIHVAAPTVDGNGIPRYDLSKIDFLGDRTRLSERLPGGDNVILTRIGDEGLTGCRAADGSHFWRIQSSNGGQPIPGLLVQPNRILGLPVTPRQGEAGPVLAINGEKGAIFLVTLDGLFLQTLGGDMRLNPPWRMPEGVIKRGSAITGVSFVDEHFHPTITQLDGDGGIYLMVGKEHSSITHLTGWETVRRCDFGTVTVGTAQVASLPAEKIEPGRKTERGTMIVRRMAAPPTVNGWPADAFTPIDARASAAVAIADKTLYAVWKTGDPHAIDGAPGDYRYQFKRGGALDLMLGTDPNADANRQEAAAGDLRLLVTRVEGKTRAVLFQQAASDAAGANTDASVLYGSPIGRVKFDQVVDVSDRVTLTASSKGDFQVAVPLSLLGMPGTLPDHLLGDIGLLRGASGQTTARVYWNNQDTNLVSDIPSEARLQPRNWGLWQFSATR